MIHAASVNNRQSLYRPHVDGLRAIAVLSVVAYHLSATALPGGYLGVDIFFVISGFLITSVIWREAKSDKLSIVRFYERRIRRIMPALILLLATVAITGCMLLLPLDLVGFAKSLIASLGFSANIYFWRDTNYFTLAAGERPLLHLWSLGVEEQFYLLFPLLVCLLAKRRPSLLLRSLLLLAGASLAADIFAVHAGADIPAFYLLPTRAWEIGFGSVIALLPMKALGEPVRWLLTTLAVLFLVIGLCFNWTPVWHAALPPAFWVVLGTTLIIYLGDTGASWVTRVLSLRVLVWIGLISYSLYLWHWPILVFARYYLVQESLSLGEMSAALVFMFACAVLSWRYVEQPFRNRRMSIRSVCVAVASGAACLLISAIVLIRHDGFPSRFDPSIAKINAAVGSEFRCGLRQTFPFGAYRACLIGTPGIAVKDVTVAFVGNSHAQMYAPLVSDVLKETGQEAILVHLNACLPMPDINISRDCLIEAAKNVTAVEDLPHVRLVILATTWKLTDPMVTPSGNVLSSEVPSVFSASLDRLIDRFEKDGKSVVLIGPIAYPNYDVASIVGRQLAYGHPIQGPLFRPEGVYRAEYGVILSHFASRKDIVFVRPDKVQCIDGKCDFFRDGTPLFADSDHLAQVSLDVFRPVIEPALLRSVRNSLN